MCRLYAYAKEVGGREGGREQGSKHECCKIGNQTAAAGIATKLMVKVTASHVAMLSYSYAYLGLTHDTPIVQSPGYNI